MSQRIFNDIIVIFFSGDFHFIIDLITFQTNLADFTEENIVGYEKYNHNSSLTKANGFIIQINIVFK